MIQSKILEKMKFLTYLRKALIALGMTCFPDGRYIRGQMIIKIKDDSLLCKETQVKFKSDRLNKISKRYALVSLDRLFAKDTKGMLKDIYRLNFNRKDLDISRAAAEYEKDDACVFAAPNFVLAPVVAAAGNEGKRFG